MALSPEAMKARKDAHLARLQAKKDLSPDEYAKDYYPNQPEQKVRGQIFARIKQEKKALRELESEYSKAISSGGDIDLVIAKAKKIKAEIENLQNAADSVRQHKLSNLTGV